MDLSALVTLTTSGKLMEVLLNKKKMVGKIHMFHMTCVIELTHNKIGINSLTFT
jgi:hypothetical protein